MYKLCLRRLRYEIGLPGNILWTFFNFFAKVFTKYYFAQLIPNFFLTRVKYIFFLLKMDVT